MNSKDYRLAVVICDETQTLCEGTLDECVDMLATKHKLASQCEDFWASAIINAENGLPFFAYQNKFFDIEGRFFVEKQ